MKNGYKIITSLTLLALSVLVLTACDNSPMQTRSDEVSGFSSVKIETIGEFIVEQGDEESLTIEAPRDFLRYIESNVQNNTLIISTRRGFFKGPIGRATFKIKVKDLNNISLSGAGAVKVFALDTDKLSVSLTGAGSVEIDDLNAKQLEVDLTSAGAIIIAGNVDKQEVNLAGVGSYEGGDLHSEDTDIKVTGAGSAVVWADEFLDVEITGVGSVSYFGDPDAFQNISGLGSVHSKGSHN